MKSKIAPAFLSCALGQTKGRSSAILKTLLEAVRQGREQDLEAARPWISPDRFEPLLIAATEAGQAGSARVLLSLSLAMGPAGLEALRSEPLHKALRIQSGVADVVVQLAFDAITMKLGPLLAACLTALGKERAQMALDADGATLGVAAARKGMDALAGKLALALGPYDVAPCGESIWGALLARQHKAGQGGSYGGKRDAERLTKTLEAIERSLWRPDWVRDCEPGRPNLIESLVGKIPLAQFLEYLTIARAAGFNPSSILNSGMDMRRATLCWLATTEPALDEALHAEEHWTLAQAALNDLRPRESCPLAKAAFANHLLRFAEHPTPRLTSSQRRSRDPQLFKLSAESLVCADHPGRQLVMDCSIASHPKGLNRQLGLRRGLGQRYFFSSRSLNGHGVRARRVDRSDKAGV